VSIQTEANVVAAPARLTRRAVIVACGVIAACRKTPPAAVRLERTSITANDPGYRVLAAVANARWAMARRARLFAENELERAIRDASRLPDETTAVFASSPPAGGRRSARPETGTAQMTTFEVVVRLQSAKEDLDGGDLAGADEDLAALAAAAPTAPATAALPLLQASEALDVATVDAANGMVTNVRDELVCAQQALEAYSGPARQADARGLARDIAARLASANGAAAVDSVQLQVWSTRIVGWV
jgi:hypothetical protein